MALADYLISVLGGLSSQLAWTNSSDQITFAVTETLEKYGVATEAEASDTKKLHCLGKVCLWRQVLNHISFDYNFSADGTSLSRQQKYEMVKQNYEDALADASQYLPENVIVLGTITTEQNPYQVWPMYTERKP